MRKKLLSMLVLLTAAAPSAWAQDEVTLTPQGESAWTLVMPASDVPNLVALGKILKTLRWPRGGNTGTRGYYLQLKESWQVDSWLIAGF